MSYFKNLIARINSSPIARNVILAVCAIVVFLFAVSLLLNIFTRHNRSEQVPDFSGLSLQQAEKLARKESLRIEINDSLFVPAFEGGVVLDQLPKPGVHVKSGRRIFLTVNSYRQKMVRIPYVTDLSLRQAKNNLEVVGLEIEKLIYRQDMAENYVLEQYYGDVKIGPRSELEAEQGSGITLVVGMNPEQPLSQAPKLIGFPYKEAKSRIWEAGLNVGEVEFDEDITLLTRNEARVYWQSPEQGTRSAPGRQVSIKLTLDHNKVDNSSSQSDKAAGRIISRQNAQQAAVQNAAQPAQQAAAQSQPEPQSQPHSQQ